MTRRYTNPIYLTFTLQTPGQIPLENMCFTNMYGMLAIKITFTEVVNEFVYKMLCNCVGL